jgi:hypothetical protein
MSAFQCVSSGACLRLNEDQLVRHQLLQDAHLMPSADDAIHVQVGHEEADLHKRQPEPRSLDTPTMPIQWTVTVVP